MLPAIVAVTGLTFLYLYHVNQGLTQVPEEVRRLSPHRWTVEEIKNAYEDAIRNPVDVGKSVPPKQNRRYIVIGGAGLVGNWIVTHLLARGEKPAAIRILDLQPPPRDILNQGVTFIQTNIVDEAAVAGAFAHPWSEAVAPLPLTVFHNAAVIRPAERHKAFLDRCRKVNVNGTANVLAAAKNHGASCFISTSSGSVALRSTSFWLPPWRRTPRNMVQVISDSTPLPSNHSDFFGNYAVSKAEAESLVRAADDLPSNFRTGCIRPANGIYGIGETSGSITTMYLKTGGNASWLSTITQNFVNAENVSIAHLLYEQRLLEHTATPTSLPNIGGQAFLITDPNPAITFSDVYLLLTTLANTPVAFPRVPAVPFFLLGYLVEWYALLQHVYLPWLLPPVQGELAQLQPGLFSVSNVHVIADDSRARMRPEDGGLGYKPPMGTLYGMCKQLEDWNRRAEGGEVLEGQEVAKRKGKVVSVSGDGGVDVNLVVPAA
ncbi:putative 3-beta hydroxysteroid dehydrogenase/isomerase family protein [Aspergillus saccharolyticus JOP 1030-1]|uniref:3-beta hydroxysteroid dehydrogenase/isomerase family protein n=1 Tax=Aspergillus saccharolyticus JOP 1030-1 TaxID=1450539 RepID=A0A318Z2I9_9EURO|nr:3-beta hydroxysteroid dehydrogenase/isomerase family protein [Aspergillus saccharolyticus JOP 1030-1]PYH41511.1 3-beta hydroxysteroid dehydrogenase/isomerase family protein [Aspergillus saccharolyticus JOP 1030-1]